jgi:hypothetical protein
VRSRGCCGFVGTAVTVMTLMAPIYRLILDRGAPLLRRLTYTDPVY